MNETELLNEIARHDYRDAKGEMLTNSREFHRLCQLAKEKQENDKVRTPPS